MRKSEKLKKLLSILMCVCMLVQYVPTVALAVETDGLCAHHTEHTPECGYVPAAAEVVCTHEHTEGCSEQVTNCLHAAHDESCGGLEDAAACTHVCSADSGCVTTILNCGHSSDGSCCYVAAVAETPCSYAVDGCSECDVEEEKTTEPSMETSEPTTETTEPALVCNCGTDDPAIHATTCAVYVAPENPVCYCAEKCTEPNVWCDVCGFDHTRCTGTDEAMEYAFSLTVKQESGSTITVEVEPNDSIDAIKTAIQEQLGIAPDQQLLYYGDTLLEDGKTLTDYGIESGAEIKLVIRYRVSIANNAGGTVTSDVGAASMGTKITLTITPNEGFLLDTLTASYGNEGGQIVEFEIVDNAFTMPSFNVTVSATFRSCTHDVYTNGCCAVCGMTCPHENVSIGTGKCTVCDLTFAASLTKSDNTVAYYADVDAAFSQAQTDGAGTVTVLRDAGTFSSCLLYNYANIHLEVPTGVTLTVNALLYLNGNISGGGTIACNSTFVTYSSSTFSDCTVTGEKEMQLVGTVTSGTFNCPVEIVNGTVNGGTFNNTVNNGGTINGGTFNGTLNNYYEDPYSGTINNTTAGAFTLGENFTISNSYSYVDPMMGGNITITGTINCTAHIWTGGTCRLCAETCDHADTEKTYADDQNGTTHTPICICGKALDPENHEMESETTGKCVCGYDIAVAKLDDVYYDSFESAVAAITAEGSTITVFTDVTIGEGETLNFPYFVPLSVAEGKTITCNGTVTIGTGDAEKAGVIFQNALYYDGGDLADIGYYWTIDESASTYYKAGEGYALYDGSGVLELHDATIQTEDYTDAGSSVGTCGIQFSDNLTIRFFGQNKVTAGQSQQESFGIYILGNLTLEGTDGATLTITGGPSLNAAESYGIYANNVTVKSGAVTAISGGGDTRVSIGVYALGIAVESGAVLNAQFGQVDTCLNGGVLSESVSGNVNALRLSYSIDEESNSGAIAWTAMGNAVVAADMAVPSAGEGETVTFTVPTGTTLTVNSGVTLDLSTMAVKDIDFSGTVVNNGTIILPDGFDIANAPKSGTITIVDKSYTWNGEKWICGEGSHQGTCTDNGDGTHSFTCTGCGETITETHTYNESHICTGCGVTETFTVSLSADCKGVSIVGSPVATYGQELVITLENTASEKVPYLELGAISVGGEFLDYFSCEMGELYLVITIPVMNPYSSEILVTDDVVVAASPYIQLDWDLNGGKLTTDGERNFSPDSNSYLQHYSWTYADGKGSEVTLPYTSGSMLPRWVEKTGYSYKGITVNGVESQSIYYPEEDVAIVVQWMPNNYTVTWNVDGTTSTTSQTYDTILTLPTAPTKSGYIFTGWFTAAEGGTEVTSGTTYKTAGETTYFAQWTECDHAENTNVPTDNADGTHSQSCSVCGKIFVDHETHSGGEATCEQGKICEVCDIEYTDPLGHDYYWTGNADSHWQVCTRATSHVTAPCSETLSHSYMMGDGNVIEVTQVCDCGYSDAFAEVSLSGTVFTYAGTAIEPHIITYPDSWLGEKNIVPAYSNNINVTDSATMKLGQYTLSFAITRATPKAEDFVLTLPTDLTYDGKAKTITVAPADGVVGMGAITVICYTPGADQENSAEPSDVNEYIVSINVTEGDNYTGITNLKVGEFTIAPANATWTAPTANILTYTGAAQELITAGTAQGGEMQYSLDNQNWSVSIPTGIDADTYTVYYKVAGDGNHKDTDVASIVVKINKAPLTITADNNSITYGDVPTANGVTGTGFMNNENFNDLSGELSYTYSYEQYGNVGTYAITPGGLSSDNYEITYLPGELTVNPKAITVQANAVSKTYGEADPVLTYAVSGTVNGDKLTGALARAEGEDVGDYGITQGTLSAGNNYTITFTGADFTISKRDVTITAKAQTITYGGTISNTEITSVGLVDGHSVTVALTPSTANVTANGTITASAAGITADGTDVTGNYNVSYTSGKLVIQPDTSKIDGLTIENVTSANEADIQAVQEMMDAAEADGADEDTLAAWAAIYETCEDLTQKIEAVEEEIARIADAVSNYDLTTVKSSDETAISQLISDIDDLLATNNLTDEERSELEGLKTKCNNLIAKIEGTETLIGQLDKTVDDLDAESVKSTDKATLEQVIADAQTLIDSGNVTEAEKEALKQIQEDAQALIKVIDDTAAEKKSVTDEAAAYDTDSVKSTEKAELEQLAKDIEDLLDTENLTEDERKALEEVRDQVQDMIDAIEDAAEDSKAATDTINALDPATVTSDDKEDLEQAIKTIDELLAEDHLTEDERKALEDAKKDAEALLDVIEAAQDALDTENTEKVEDVTSGNVKPEDKEALEDAKADLEKALEDNASNYTEEEKQAIQDEIQRIEDAIEALENAEDVTDAITQLPDTVEPDDEEAAEKIMDAKEAYDELTDHEKSLVEKDLKEKLDDLVKSLTDYKIIKGNGGKWTKGSSYGLSFTANGLFSKFVGIEVDGKEVDAKYYDAKPGSTIITLKQSYLKRLSTGEHTITVLYTDGETSGTFKILAASSSPATGDDSNIVLWSAVLCVSTLGMVALLIGSKKKRSTK